MNQTVYWDKWLHSGTDAEFKSAVRSAWRPKGAAIREAQLLSLQMVLIVSFRTVPIFLKKHY